MNEVDEDLIRAFAFWAHVDHPDHDLRERVPEMIQKARGANSNVACVFVIEHLERRITLMRRFDDFAAGWRAARR